MLMLVHEEPTISSSYHEAQVLKRREELEEGVVKLNHP